MGKSVNALASVIQSLNILVSIDKMIISADSNFIIVGTVDSSIIIHDIQLNRIHCRFDNVHHESTLYFSQNLSNKLV